MGPFLAAPEDSAFLLRIRYSAVPCGAYSNGALRGVEPSGEQEHDRPVYAFDLMAQLGQGFRFGTFRHHQVV